METARDRFKKFQDKRKQASNANFKEVLEENERLKRPLNWERKAERLKEEVKKLEEIQTAEQNGEDYKQKKLLEVKADDAQRWDKLNAAKRRPNPGGIDYEATARRQHERLVKQIKPNFEEYEKTKKAVGEDVFYLKSSDGVASVGTVALTASLQTVPAVDPKSLYVDSKEGVERLVEDVKKQMEVKSKRNRRRKFDHEADVNYINERNMRFNKKLDRFYEPYTSETKANLERGTAL